MAVKKWGLNSPRSSSTTSLNRGCSAISVSMHHLQSQSGAHMGIFGYVSGIGYIYLGHTNTQIMRAPRLPVPGFPHPSIYNLWHHLQYSLFLAPIRYSPTHAPGYWVDTNYGRSRIARLAEPLPFPLQRAVVNGMYEIDSLMVAPGVLVMRTPRLDEFKPWFYRIDFEQIFGHMSLGVTPNFPLEFIPNSLVIATGVKAFEEDWEPSECTKERWATQSRPPWVAENGKDGPELARVKSGRPWEGAPVLIASLSPQSTTSGPSDSCATPSSTTTRPPTA